MSWANFRYGSSMLWRIAKYQVRHVSFRNVAYLVNESMDIIGNSLPTGMTVTGEGFVYMPLVGAKPWVASYYPKILDGNQDKLIIKQIPKRWTNLGD